MAKFKLLVPRAKLTEISDAMAELTRALHDSSDDREHINEAVSAKYANILESMTDELDIQTNETAGAGSLDYPLVEEMGKLWRQRYDTAKEAGSDKIANEAIGAMKALKQILTMLPQPEAFTEASSN